MEEHFSLILVNTIKYKKKKIEILLTKDSFAYAVGHSIMLFTQVASIFNISDIANVI